jgi:hypothetical protein
MNEYGETDFKVGDKVTIPFNFCNTTTGVTKIINQPCLPVVLCVHIGNINIDFLFHEEDLVKLENKLNSIDDINVEEVF